MISPLEKKPKVLLLSFDRPDFRALGGVALHVASLARNSSNAAEVFTAHATQNELHVERWKPRRLVLVLPLDGTEEGFQRALYTATAGIGARVVHVHSALLHPDATAAAARRAGARLAVTLHDHALVCENYTLLEGGRRHCDVPRDLARCDACLAVTLAAAPGAVGRHREKMRRLVTATDAFVAPSHSVLELALRVHPEMAERAVRIDWGVSKPALPPFRSAREPGPLRIAFVGLLSRPKGRERLAPLLAACRDLDVEWHFFGATEGASVRDLKRAAPRVVVHGSYLREDLALGLSGAGCHVGFLPSIFAESFSLALSDVTAAGLPVLVSNLGALAERVEGEALGWTFDPWTPASLFRVVSELCHTRSLVDDAAVRVRSRAVRTEAEMADAHVKLWRELAPLGDAPSPEPDGAFDADFRAGEARARKVAGSRVAPMVNRLRGSRFYRDLPLRRFVPEAQRKAVENILRALVARARRR